MALIKNDDVIGYIVGEKHVCPECATQEEQRDVTLDNILTENDHEIEGRYFCDRCKEEM